VDDSNRIIEEILATSHALAELDQDGLDGSLRIREELRLRRRALLDQLKTAKPVDLGEITAPLETHEEPAKPAGGRRRSSRHRRRAA
jgi:hypothetical protein